MQTRVLHGMRAHAALRCLVVAQSDPERISALRSTVPKHVAIVMDGNGRWAQRRGLKRTDGHAAGEEALFDTVEGALEIGLEWMTVYAFSTENWRRPLDEVRFLMNFNERLLVARRDELNGKGVRVRFIGRRGGSGAASGAAPHRGDRGAHRGATAGSRSRSRSTTAAGPSSSTRCARSRARPRPAGSIPTGSTSASIRRHLYAPDMPDPDLLVRTSGEHRISNYLLWQVAYSELVLHRRAVARLPPRAPLRRDRGVPAAANAASARSDACG